MAAWLKSCGIRTVAMQSTGVYWIAVQEVLEPEGIEVYLVHARGTKNLPGRKSDAPDVAVPPHSPSPPHSGRSAPRSRNITCNPFRQSAAKPIRSTSIAGEK